MFSLDFESSTFVKISQSQLFNLHRVSPGVGLTLVHVVGDRLFPSRALTACRLEWFPTSSCTLWALCTSSLAWTGTTMSPSCGQTFGGVTLKGREILNFFSLFTTQKYNFFNYKKHTHKILDKFQFLLDRLRNFEKFRTDTLDLPYDYRSIMHFGMYVKQCNINFLAC